MIAFGGSNGLIIVHSTLQLVFVRITFIVVAIVVVVMMIIIIIIIVII